MPVIESTSSRKDSDRTVVQAWVPPCNYHRVLANVFEHLDLDPVSGQTYKMPHITGFHVLDDRAGSGHFWMRFDPKEVTAKQLLKLVGKDIQVSVEPE